MKLVSIGLSLTLLAGCASYRPPGLPLAATAEERQRSARCEVLAAQEARDTPSSLHWEKWVPGNALDFIVAPVAYPVMAWQIKKERELTFDLAYQRCTSAAESAR